MKKEKMNMKRLKKLKRNIKGITLIALVVTIIVLLILAGVAINLSIGQNGIFSRAQDAATTWKNAEKNEQIAMKEMEEKIEGYNNEEKVEVEQVIDKNPGILEGNGTDGDPYVINSIEDLVVFANNVKEGNTYKDNTIELGLSLDFNSDKSYVDPNREDYSQYGYSGNLKEMLTTGEGFEPIGSLTSNDYSFYGTFDAKNNIIYNIYINYNNISEENSIGLFAINNGTIKNVILEGVNYNVVNESEYKSYLGGIAGTNNGTIEGCSVNGIMKHSSKKENGLGGIAGHTINNGIINESINMSTLIGNSMTGGISGYWTGGIISNCKNEGKVETNADENYCYAAGITAALGDNENYQIIGCYNKGSIIANANGNKYIQAGGISGYNGGNVLNCVNEGDVSATHINNEPNIRVGGILGINARNMENCLNQGNVYCNRENTAGGLVTNNTGIAKKSMYLKGITGIVMNSGTIEDIEEIDDKLNEESINNILNGTNNN